MINNQIYIDVVLPLPVKGTFTYSFNHSIDVGQRVIVQFGNRKLYSGIVCKIHSIKPGYKVKDILSVIDEEPVISQKDIDFWTWMSDYYMCNIGDVMNTALPSSFKLTSESKVVFHSCFDGDVSCLEENERILINILSDQEEVRVSDISSIIKVKNIFSFINNMIIKELLQIKEELHDKYKEKSINILLLNDCNINDVDLTIKQGSFLDAYMNLKNLYPEKEYKVTELLNAIGFSRSILNNLIKKGVFRIEKRNISRIIASSDRIIPFNDLTCFQKGALSKIKESFLDKDVCLLHGVTSSGKTEIYIKLISQELEKGNQVLYLLPEIALTTQIINRLKKYFGNKVGVYHSYVNDLERVEVWRSVQDSINSELQCQIILGTRSSLFLPFNNLGLIIIDEEHDSSFKQHHVSPRYNARDSAIYLAKLHNAKVVLGSATPCLESYYNTIKGKYALVNMNNRFSDIRMPEINIVDIRKAHLKKKMVHQFSPELLNSITNTIDSGKQVILFQNRRGYSSFISCDTCAFVVSCVQCDVSLTYYKWENKLKCHYCGYTESIPDNCPSCSSKDFNDKGYGTEQIQESLEDLLPGVTIKRMDYNTTRGKYSYQKIINDFEQGNTDVLVGTQMIAKGLDFDNVALVGILNADNMLYFPDFRSYERAFQLITQVSGRAGRRDLRGKVIIQTYDPQNYIFDLLKKNDYVSFIKMQLQERKLFSYPPYNRLIRITLKHKNQRKIDIVSSNLAALMRKYFKGRVLGPEYPLISKVRNYYHKNILLKIDNNTSVYKVKHILSKIIESVSDDSYFKSVRFLVDVDVL